ncbi:aminopeptidase N-like [Polyergus mexicanus]|uniref:aminopeptidase N-like n=1 Tax=Polyergus mexicanus TaxID=615972 RepID=UPI0038B4E7AF
MEKVLLRLILNSVLYLTAIAFFFSPDYRNDFPVGFRLPYYVIPEHYNIQLDLAYFDVEEKNFNFSGTCEAYIKIIRPTWYISLHAQKPQIEVQNATLVNKESLELYKPTNVTYNEETHILVFHFGYELSNGHYLLNMSFINFSDDDGNSFFRTVYTSRNDNENKKLFIAKQFHAIGARQLFPCWDEPALKATFNISVRHHVKYAALSNMPMQDMIEDADHILWTYFKITPLMSTYLVMFALYDVFPHTTLYRMLYQEIMFASNVTDIIITCFVNKWKYSENISDVYHIITSGSRNNGTRIILYREASILYNKAKDPVTNKIEVARTLAYELTHQWFDNLISPSWWSDYWLNEGIATLLGMDIMNKIFPDFRVLDLFVVQIQQESLRLDNFRSDIMKPLISEVNKTSDIDSLFSFSYYIKAPVILRMLQHFLTDNVFQNGIEIFLSKHKFSSATIDDFWNAMQTAHDVAKISNIEKLDIRKEMSAWTKQKHYPVLKITQPNFEYLEISIENIKNLGKDNWFIPVIITKQTDSDFIVYKNTSWQMYNKWKAQSNLTLSIDLPLASRDDEWIIANLQQNGYYRVNYEPKNWRSIAKYLNSANYAKIHVLNRAQIIDDAYYFLSIGQLDLDIFLELAKYLSQETDYVAWYPMIKVLEDMSSIFPILDERVDLVKKSMQEILDGVLEQIGYEEHSEDNILTKYLRQEVAKWACIIEHPKCIQMAKQNLERHIIHSEKLLPWWKQWTYCNGIKAEEDLNGIWSTMLEKWALDSDNRILEFLTCIAHPNPIQEYLNTKTLQVYLDLKFSQKDIFSKFQDIDRVNRFLMMIMKHVKNDVLLEYVLQNFEEIKPREVSTIAALIIIINHVYSEAQLKKIMEFVENNLIKQENIIIINNLTTSIFFHNEFDKIHEYARNFVHERISFIYRKIEKRLYELTLIQNRIRKVFKLK